MNKTTLAAQLFVDELARSGLQHVCLAPGSRNTPLVLAFAQHGKIKVHSHLDERSAAFYALGLALATDTPVALVCTSGTAAANFFPAIVEAHQSCVPLLVLTADRPPELRHSGANQTIDQIKLYGDYALWFVDAALPEAHPPAVAIRNLRTLANRAFATANGLRKGVVHINLPFRSPLEPTPIAEDVTEIPLQALAREGAFSQLPRPHPPRLLRAEIETLVQVWERQHGIIICGPRSPQGNEFHRAVISMADALSYPLFVDSASGVRFHGEKILGDSLVISSYETLLGALPKEWVAPNVILRFGDVPTSKVLNTYLANITPEHRVHITADGVWADDQHEQTLVLQTDPIHFCNEIYDVVWDKVAWSDPAIALHHADTVVWENISKELERSPFFDGMVVFDVLEHIPADSTLFVGNSLSVRHLDQFGKPSAKPIRVFANRGASGIDGNLSTALGAGAARPDHPLVAIVGDVTFYHDMNGLLAVKRCGVPITIVLLNNNGGGIFYRLPIKEYDPEFTDLFVTPHGLDFSHAAHLYGLDYVQAADRASFQQAFQQSVTERRSMIIEVRTDAQEDFARRNALVKAVQQALAGR